MRKLKLAAYYYQEKGSMISKIQRSNEPITMLCYLDFPKIIVLENPDYNFELTEVFPE